MLATFFEGPEKKVELAVSADHGSLRALPDEHWHRVVAASKAQVLSKLSSAACDAYLLSESSLFVWEDHVTMITCGRTRLVDAVAEMLSFIPREKVALLIYERKNEHFPERQPTSFYEDAQQLTRWLPGRAFRFGTEHDHFVQLFYSTAPYVAEPTDTTLEVLMHGLHEDTAARFIGMNRSRDRSVAAQVGIDRILPGFDLDEYVFEPAGYSLNALKDELYYTIHVTPERMGSYVSFETNVDFRKDPNGLVQRVLEVFRPASFDVVAFSPSPGGDLGPMTVPGYRQKDHVVQDLAGYRVSYLHYFAPPRGPAAAFEIPLPPA